MSKPQDDSQLIFGTIGPLGTNLQEDAEISQDQILNELRSVGDFDKKYKVLEPIGKGGMGRVFKAQDRNLGRTVAIKQMLPSAIGNQDALKRFQRESQIAGGLNHPHIITVYDSGMTQYGPYLVMEYASRGDLGSLCRKGAVDPATVIEYGIQICKALSRAHDEGIIHRDIKPQNILLQSHHPREPAVAKLADFGLAWSGDHRSISQNRREVGTAYYRSPEQTLGDKLIDSRSDIYSLGATLYHLLSGIPPIQMRLERIPEPIRELVSPSTEWEAKARYASVNEMQRALEQCKSRIDPVSKSKTTAGANKESEVQAPIVQQKFYSKPSKKSKSLPTEFTNSLGMQFKLIPTGRFLMGSPESEAGRCDDETQHEVILTRPYYMGIYPVTQGEFERVMGSNPSYFKGDRHPVESVSWDDAMACIQRLNSITEERSQGWVYRLPTESEWEYACRAGSTTAYCFGDEAAKLGTYAWYKVNSNIRTQPVGQKQPNGMGFYDMHGNVWEWCSDWYGEYPKGSVTNPVGPSIGSIRVLRGGSWRFEATYCRSADRFRHNPSDRNLNLGFRIALSSTGIAMSPEMDK